MIHIIANRAEYSTEARALMTAFYPGIFLYYEVLEETDHPQRLNKEQEKEPIEWTFHIEICDQSLRIYDPDCEERGKSCRLSSEGRDRKNTFKRLLYFFLSDRTGKELPWGTLTGVRPTKLALQAYLAGEEDKQIRQRLEEEYLVSDLKINLALSVARKELEILKPFDPVKGYSLYVGVPFCPTTCAYCSFPSYNAADYADRIETYVEALKEELVAIAEAARVKGKVLHTIYFGGGTPTTLSADQLREVTGCIRRHFDLSECKEWTVEAGRPDSITLEKLEALKEAGVDRISVNPQTMKQETLDLIGRHHSVNQVREALKLARAVGFSAINMDLILGLPGESKEDVKRTLDEMKSFHPENLTIHSLAMKHNSRMNREDWRENYRMENSNELMEFCYEECDKMGLKPYYMYRQKQMAGNQENVGFATDGTEGIYNILMMEEWESIYSAGVAAMTKFVGCGERKITRLANPKEVDYYLSHLAEIIKEKKEAISLS